MSINAPLTREDMQQTDHEPVFAIREEAIQKICARWRRLKGGNSTLVDTNGVPIPIPPMVVPEDFTLDLESGIVPIIEDQCEEALANWERSGVDRRAGVKRPPAVLPAISGTIKVMRSDMVRKR